MWKKAKVYDLLSYQRELELELSKIDIPAEAAICNEPERCSHKHIIQTYFDGVCSAMLKSAKRCIPRTKCNCNKKFQWDEDLKAVKREERKDYCLWRDAGRPRGGSLYCLMRESRKRFKRKIKPGSEERMSYSAIDR